MTRSSAGPPPPSDCSSSSSAASAAASRSNPARPPHPPTHPLHDRVPPQRRLGGGGPIRVARCVTCPARASAPGPLKLGRAGTAGADVPSPWAGRRMLRRGARAPAKGSTSPARNAARKPPPPAQPRRPTRGAPRVGDRAGRTGSRAAASSANAGPKEIVPGLAGPELGPVWAPRVSRLTHGDSRDPAPPPPRHPMPLGHAGRRSSGPRKPARGAGPPLQVLVRRAEPEARRPV